MEYLDLILAVLGTTTATTIVNYFLFRRKNRAEGDLASLEVQRTKITDEKELLKEWNLILEEVIEVRRKAAEMSLKISKLEMENKGLKAEKQGLELNMKELEDKIRQLMEALNKYKGNATTSDKEGD